MVALFMLLWVEIKLDSDRRITERSSTHYSMLVPSRSTKMDCVGFQISDDFPEDNLDKVVRPLRFRA